MLLVIRQLHSQLHEALQHRGVRFAAPPSTIPALLDQAYACAWCEHSFDTRQKLQAHQWLAHQIISDERRYVYSGTCLACKRCFWSTARLQQHLRLFRKHSNGCYAQMTWRYAPLRDAVAADIPDDLRGYRLFQLSPSVLPVLRPLRSSFTLMMMREAFCNNHGRQPSCTSL